MISRRYPVESEDLELLLADASLQAKLGALAVIHAVGSTGGLIYPIEINDQTIAPNASLSKDFFIAAWQGGLLQVHPTSPVTAFSWDSETVLGEGFYTNRTRFFVPGDGPSKTESSASSTSFWPSWTRIACTRPSSPNLPSSHSISSQRKPDDTSFTCSASTTSRT